MGRARFIIYLRFIFFINRAARGRARFIIYLRFIFLNFFFYFSRGPDADPRSASFESRNLWCFSKRCWNINTRTMLQIFSRFFLLCVKYFRVGFIKALDSKGIINTLKRYYVAMECADCSFHFGYVTNKIVFTLRVNNLARSDRHDFICSFASISYGLRQMEQII